MIGGIGDDRIRGKIRPLEEGMSAIVGFWGEKGTLPGKGSVWVGHARCAVRWLD